MSVLCVGREAESWRALSGHTWYDEGGWEMEGKVGDEQETRVRAMENF